MRVAAAVLFLFSSVAIAQVHQPSTPPREAPSFRTSSSDLVVLPVVVTDKRGRFVADLARERFHVFDNDRHQDLSLFSSEDTPVTVGLLVDDSGSVGPKLGEIVAAALAFARASNPEDGLFTLKFNDHVQDAIQDGEIAAGDVGGLQAALSGLVPQGRTALYDALVAGLDRLESSTRPRRVLILVSDGGDNASQNTQAQVLERARASNVTIYTIGIFDPRDPDSDPSVLKSVAQATGGKRFLPQSPGELLLDCQSIAREVRSGYTIAYQPPDRDGRFHRVRVDVDRDDGPPLMVRTRPGYFAGTEARP